MKIVVKETLLVFDASELPKPGSGYSHIQFDFGDLVAVAEVLDSVGIAILQMPDEPMYDSRYQRITVGAVIENDGVYSSDWVLSLNDFNLSEVAEMIAADLSLSCEKSITAGFYSSALGSSHFYSCDMAAQLNIQANCLAASIGRDVRHVCTNLDGVRAIRDHTSAQMIAVGDSMGEHIWVCLDKIDALRMDIATAIENNDAVALIGIKWA